MQLTDDQRTILSRILAATVDGRLKWRQEFDGWYSAAIGAHNERILIRRMFIEATNQVGADPYFVQFSLPGWSGRYAIVDDSEGWQWIRKILEAGIGGWDVDYKRTLDYLDVHLPESPQNG
jgi:hypothetical protein